MYSIDAQRLRRCALSILIVVTAVILYQPVQAQTDQRQCRVSTDYRLIPVTSHPVNREFRLSSVQCNTDSLDWFLRSADFSPI